MFDPFLASLLYILTTKAFKSLGVAEIGKNYDIDTIIKMAFADGQLTKNSVASTTDKTIIALVQICPDLTYIDLRECHNVTDNL